VGIVPGAFLVVGEDFVCRLDLGEEGSGAFGVAMVAVRVQFEGLFAICLFESVCVRQELGYEVYSNLLVLCSGSLDTQQLIVTRLDLAATPGSFPASSRLSSTHSR
jgi:hypothetical protein